MAAVGILLLTGLLLWSPFPVDMIGDGEPVTNTAPPSIALLAFAAAQLGILLAAEPAASRLLPRPPALAPRQPPEHPRHHRLPMAHGPCHRHSRHLLPLGIMPQPPIATAEWWLLRLAWFALLTLVLIPIVLIFTPADRPLPARSPDRPVSPAVLLVGYVAAAVGLAKLAIAGFAPDGRLPLLVLAAYAVGLAALAAAPRLARLRPRSGSGP